MSDTVKLIIEIPKEDFKKLVNPYQHNEVWCNRLKRMVMNGTPLPKGHGRLIDADAYRKEMLDSREFDFFKRLDMQPTIIKADKGESEERNDKRGIFADCKATSVSL